MDYEYRYPDNEYRHMDDDELLASYDASGEYILEQSLEICRRAGLEDEWAAADPDTCESVLWKAVDILRQQQN